MLVKFYANSIGPDKKKSLISSFPPISSFIRYLTIVPADILLFVGTNGINFCKNLLKAHTKIFSCLLPSFNKSKARYAEK